MNEKVLHIDDGTELGAAFFIEDVDGDLYKSARRYLAWKDSYKILGVMKV